MFYTFISEGSSHLHGADSNATDITSAVCAHDVHLQKITENFFS